MLPVIAPEQREKKGPQGKQREEEKALSKRRLHTAVQLLLVHEQCCQKQAAQPWEPAAARLGSWPDSSPPNTPQQFPLTSGVHIFPIYDHILYEP